MSKKAAVRETVYEVFSEAFVCVGDTYCLFDVNQEKARTHRWDAGLYWGGPVSTKGRVWARARPEPDTHPLPVHGDAQFPTLHEALLYLRLTLASDR